MSDAQRTAGPSRWDILARADVLSGLLFVAIAALGLIALSWSIFIFGLGLTIPVWPEW